MYSVPQLIEYSPPRALAKIRPAGFWGQFGVCEGLPPPGIVELGGRYEELELVTGAQVVATTVGVKTQV